MGAAQSPQVAAQQATQQWLQYAATSPWTQIGSLASGATGGSNSLFTLNPSDIPVSPSWCSAIDYQFTLPIQVVVPAGQAFTWSPFFPYSAILQALVLAGAPPWNLMEMTAWYLDEITRRRGFDPTYAGLGQSSPTTAASDPFQDDGGTETLAGIVPGATTTNGGTGSETLSFTVVFRVRQQLQRRRHLGYGLIPFGDSENRPQQKIQLAGLVGSNPEQNAIVNAGAGVVASLSAQATVNVVYELAALDILPSAVAGTPSPTTGMGLQVDAYSPSIQNAGAIQYQAHKTAMLYEAIHHLIVNGELAIRPDYFALWLTNKQQNARWTYDASQNTFNQYFADVHRRYGRYLPKGHYIADLAGGEVPEFPQATPYQGLMTPDVALAGAMGIAPTPAMSTAFRIPSGTAMSGAYARIYGFGLVPVPY